MAPIRSTVDDILDLVTSLVEKSLINMEESDEGARYRVLETIRDYACEKLVLRDEQIKLAGAHCDYFFVMAKAANQGLQGAEQGANGRAGSRWSTTICALRLQVHSRAVATLYYPSSSLLHSWDFGCCGVIPPKVEGTCERRWTPAVQASDFLHGHALYVGATLAYSQSDYKEALEMLDAASPSAGGTKSRSR